MLMQNSIDNSGCNYSQRICFHNCLGIILLKQKEANLIQILYVKITFVILALLTKTVENGRY